MNNKKIKKKNLNSNTSMVYLSTTLIFIVGLILFLTSRMYIPEVIPMKYTELNVVNDLYSDGKITINEWKYDEKQNIMEVILKTDKVKGFDNDLHFSSVSRVDRQRYLDVEVPYKENDIYVVVIKNVPKQFEQIALRIDKEYNDYYDLFTEDEEVKEKESNTVAALYTDQRMVDRGTIEQKSPKRYAIQIVTTLVENAESDSTTIRKSIEKINKAIEILRVEVSEKEEDKIYQTAEEQLETDSTIHSLLYKIEEMEDDKVKKEEEIIINDKKIEKLNQKKNDLKMGN